MSTFVGTDALVRLALRRDRVLLPVWVAVFAFMATVSAGATVGLYPTESSRVQAADAINRTQSLVALYGRIYDPTSLGAIAMVKLGGIGAVFVAILAVITVLRHTRAEEETGRAELVGAGMVGRHAPLTAALAVAVGANLAIAVTTAVGLTAAGLPLEGSAAFGLSWAGVGIAFAAIAGVAAQLTTSTRAATGLAIAVLGLVYILRAIGDTASTTGPRWLVWLSPVGWGQQFRPYAGNRWWVLLITAGFTVVVIAVAYAVAARRDLGAGLLPDRPGPAAAHATLRSPLALAWRLQRGTLAAWTAWFVLLGAVFGNIASSVADFLNSSQARDVITKLGGQKGLTDAFLAAELSLIGVIASAYGIQAALRMRTEETSGRAEPVLATAISRIRWAAGHLTMALGGTALLMAAAGLTAGLTHAARVGDAGEIGRVLVGALVQLPAAWVLTAITVATFGLVPRLAAVGWAALIAFLLLGELGPLLRLQQWVMDISPFAHTPKLPGAPLQWTPLITLTAVAAVLTTAGLGALRRRNIG